jgi:hypothetical protein
MVLSIAQQKTAPKRGFALRHKKFRLALARLEARVGLVDDINPAAAADYAAILVPDLHRFQRVNDFHGLNPSVMLVCFSDARGK